ncbi:hypothetical protein [Candidatus Desulfovibrio trichonymphae]|uniref:hypothetical protein n=1 Tax=Candidatus Desulfovibrio trichonymphae TaxID=1725232 RepID=UPI001E3BF109|nr:hypothetical protein [Candidatus Desulfovibrio trichonymphae]GHU99013.1 hypothetical protein AGMMS50248_06470 [Deltaproteobacteria bacterium]
MRLHEQRETRHPVYSFGQGCEGDPLMDADLLAESIQTFRDGGGRGTINCNTNVSRPEAVIRLAQAGMTSLRGKPEQRPRQSVPRLLSPHGLQF